MKRAYKYVSAARVRACKDLARIVIKLNSKEKMTSNAAVIEWQVSRFFDSLDHEFRCDLEDWINEEIEKGEKNVKKT